MNLKDDVRIKEAALAFRVATANYTVAHDEYVRASQAFALAGDKENHASDMLDTRRTKLLAAITEAESL